MLNGTYNKNLNNLISIQLSKSGQYQTAISNSTLYVSNNYGLTWSSPITSDYLIDIAISSSGKYQLVYSNLRYTYTFRYSSDYGVTWNDVNENNYLNLSSDDDDLNTKISLKKKKNKYSNKKGKLMKSTKDNLS